MSGQSQRSMVQQFDRLRGQRHQVINFHLHFAGGDAPLCRVKVDLCPFRHAKFAGPHKHQWGQFERSHSEGCPV